MGAIVGGVTGYAVGAWLGVSNPFTCMGIGISSGAAVGACVSLALRDL